MKKNRQGIIVIMLMSLLAVAAAPPRSFAGTGWEADILVDVSGATNRLSFGQQADATDGRDALYDVPPMLGGSVSAYFSESDGPYWRDIKSLAGGPAIWKLHIESSLTGHDVVISWDPGKLQKATACSLRDPGSGRTVNMKSFGSYSYRNSGMKELTVEVLR